ncbi:hypothetical protein ACGFK1_16555 [Mycobacterium sp. NPDC048908]|uniref:hypothetical protein n=1 Tax=Mycobacterium sp. NPDC048908 TaxID=3364292 RepID=UPI003713758E
MLSRLNLIGGADASAVHRGTAYAEQEGANTAALGLGGGLAGGAPRQRRPSPCLGPLDSDRPVGVTPTDGKTIAALIHSGPGHHTLRAAADQARRHAAELRDISAELGAAEDRMEQARQSSAGDAVLGRP